MNILGVNHISQQNNDGNNSDNRKDPRLVSITQKTAFEELENYSNNNSYHFSSSCNYNNPQWEARNIKSHSMGDYKDLNNYQYQEFKNQLKEAAKLFEDNLNSLNGKLKLPNTANHVLTQLNKLNRQIDQEFQDNGLPPWELILKATNFAMQLLSQMNKSEEIISLYLLFPIKQIPSSICKSVKNSCISALCSIKGKKVVEIFNLFKSEETLLEFYQIIKRAIEENERGVKEKKIIWFELSEIGDSPKLIQLMKELSKYKRTDLIREIKEKCEEQLNRQFEYQKFSEFWKIMTYAYFRSGDFKNAYNTLKTYKLKDSDVAWIHWAQIRALLKVGMKKQAIKIWQEYQRIEIKQAFQKTRDVNTVANIEIAMFKGLSKSNGMRSIISHFESKTGTLGGAQNYRERLLEDILIRTLLKRGEIRLAWKALCKIINHQIPPIEICNDFLAALYKEELNNKAQSSQPSLQNLGCSIDHSSSYPNSNEFFNNMGWKGSHDHGPSGIKYLPFANTQTYIVRIIAEFSKNSANNKKQAREYLNELLTNTHINIRPLLDCRHFNMLLKKLISINELKEAEDLFNNENLIKNTKSYSIMMRGYLKSKKPEKVKELFEKMQQIGHFRSIDIHNLYLESLKPKEAIDYFDWMKNDSSVSELLNSTTYNIRIKKYLERDGVAEALWCFKKMQEEGFILPETYLFFINSFELTNEQVCQFFRNIKMEDREEVFYEALIKRLLNHQEDARDVEAAQDFAAEFKLNNTNLPFRRTVMFDSIASFLDANKRTKEAIDFANKHFPNYWNNRTLNAVDLPPFCASLLVRDKLNNLGVNESVEMVTARGLYLESNEYRKQERETIEDLEGQGYRVEGSFGNIQHERRLIISKKAVQLTR